MSDWTVQRLDEQALKAFAEYHFDTKVKESLSNYYCTFCIRATGSMT